MSYELNQKIRELKPYAPLEGEYAVRLDANESYLSLSPEKLGAVFSKAMQEPLNRYPDPRAEKLCRAFAGYYGVRPEHCTAGNGSDELIALITSAFFVPGDELITLEQDFSMYRFYGEVSGVTTSIFPKRPDLTVNLDGLIEYASRTGARGLIFSNPCNPTSICLEKKQVIKLVQALPNCLVVVDEAYMDFADESVLSEIERYDNLMVLKTCSKAIGLAGIRLGFAVAGELLTRALQSVKSPYNVNSLTQVIGREVLSDRAFLEECTEELIRARDQLYSRILSLYARYQLIDEVYQTASNFVYFRTRYAKPIFEALKTRSIAIRYMGDYLRICAGSKDEMERLFEALEEIFQELSGMKG